MVGLVIPLVLVRQRRSLIRQPQRDIRINQGEDVQFQITLYQNEGDTTPIDMRSGRVWFALERHPGRGYRDWDYGFGPCNQHGPVLVWSTNNTGLGTAQVVDQTNDQTSPLPAVEIDIPSNVNRCWGGVYGYVLQVDFDGATSSAIRGAFHVERMAQASQISANDMSNDFSPDFEATGQG